MTVRRSLMGATAVGLALAAAPAGADERAARLGPVVEFGIEGGFLLNESDDGASFDDGDKYGDINDLMTGDEGGYFALSGRFHIDETLAVDGGFSATFLEPEDSGNFSGLGDYGSNDLDFETVDASLVYKLDDDFALFGGVRAMHLSSKVEAFGGFASDTIDANGWLIGPRLGGDMNLRFDGFPVGLVGSLSGSVLFGSIDVEGSFPGMSDGATAYNLEGSLALSYEVADGVQLQAGYRAQQFWNLAPQFEEIGTSGYDYGGEGDMLLHGPFAKVHLSF